MIELKMNGRPDGLGFFYGEAFKDEKHLARVDLLPPYDEWEGDAGRDQCDPTQWKGYVDGEFVASAMTRLGIEAKVKAFIMRNR